MASMPTEGNTTRLEFGTVEGWRIEACFDGGTIAAE